MQTQRICATHHVNKGKKTQRRKTNAMQQSKAKPKKHLNVFKCHSHCCILSARVYMMHTMSVERKTSQHQPTHTCHTDYC